MKSGSLHSESVLACYFACAAGVDHEGDWIDDALGRIETQINHREWATARATCENFAVDIEGHFAFEELVIARTGFAPAREHRLNHSAGLTVINDLIRGLGAIGAASTPDRDATSLLARLRDFGLHAKAHVDRHDRFLCLHAGRVAGMPESKFKCS
jgi:hemerythrin